MLNQDELAKNREPRTPTNSGTPDFFKTLQNAPKKAPRPQTPDTNPSFDPSCRLF